MRVMTHRLWAAGALLAALACAPALHAQGGPPLLTTDPGTPGNANWEINVGAMSTHTSAGTSSQLPQLDVNFGVGDRVQLTYQQSYVVQTGGSPAGAVSGYGNALLGVKWRFVDEGEGGWQVSAFPQFETAGSARAQRGGIAIDGPRVLLPLEVGKRIGPLDVNLEAGYYVARNGPEERFVGLALGRQVNARFELDGEVYADRASGAPPNDTTLDVGFRYRLHPAFILLGMAGRSIAGNGGDHVQFMGYLGVQVLLSDYGRSLQHAP
jgi:hypothetical protein